MDYRFSILVKKPEMLSALSTVPPPTLFVNLLFLKVSTCRWVCFLVLLHLGETRDNYSTLMPLHIPSFGWAFSPRLSLVLRGHSVTRPSLSFQLGVAASALFLSMCIYLWPAFFLSGDSMVSRTAHTFLFPNHTLPSHSACFDSLKYLAVALSLSLVQYFSSV